MILDSILNLLGSVVTKPIGVYNKSYKYMVMHLDRNIGSGAFQYDGYTTPIGYLCNPWYNALSSKEPTFFTDEDKKKYSTYLDYIKYTNGASLSVENLNEKTDFKLSLEDASVGTISGSRLKDAIEDSEDNTIITNPNKEDNDSTLGKVSSKFAKLALKQSITENDKRTANKNAISEDVINYFGLNTSAFTSDILSISDRKSKTTGRYEDLSPLSAASPIKNGQGGWGFYNSMGVYEPYYKSTPSDTTRSYIDENIGRNQYRVTTSSNNTSSGNTYIDYLNITVSKESMGSSEARYIFKTVSNSDTMYTRGVLKTYGELENGSTHDMNSTFNSGIATGKYRTFGTTLTVDDLLKKTNNYFRQGKLKTLISRFHTSASDTRTDDITETAVSKQYGASHGRNLLKVTPTKENGYDNPYCRVWTYHHQYHRLQDAIRPFIDSNYSVLANSELFSNYNYNSFRTANHGLGNSGERLDKYGTMNPTNGLINLSPINDGEHKVDIKNCMFSIENLAWKGMFSKTSNGNALYAVNGLSDEQTGPFGGRIMWFPPYDLKFSEQVTANWNSLSFIGRGEDMYTYANTTRSGNLSFMMLIDHPAILDYWAGKGKTDVSSTVDDTSSYEQTLLRFFAGCSMLSAKKTTDTSTETVSTEDEETPMPSTGKIIFFVFFPNDYSGQDDDPIDAMMYLVNGVGARKYWNKQSGTQNTTDYDIRLRKVYRGNTSSSLRVGGYEVRPNVGVSVISSAKGTESESSFLCNVWQEKNNDSNKSLLKLGKWVSPKRKDGKYSRWCYRIDKRWQNEIFNDADNYVDTDSYQLNSGGNRQKIINAFGVESDSLFSFVDVYCAIAGSYEADAVNVLEDVYDASQVKTIQNLLNTYDIKKITVKAWASSHGITINDTRNNNLIENRGKTVINWLKNCSKIKCDNYKRETGNDTKPGSTSGDASGITPKLYRCAQVTIQLNTEEVTTSEKGSSASKSSSTETSTTNLSKALFGARNNKFEPPSMSKDLENKIVERPMSTVVAPKPYSAVTYTKTKKKVGEIISNVSGGISKSLDKYTNQMNNGTVDLTTDSLGITSKSSTGNYVSQSSTMEGNRYEDEGKFFKLLETNEPFLHHKITDKIKYFDPAFHSVSPEGFNARLTFLHQCTRQGPTIGGSDEANITANNLAFGRQPVCILRIGDFYYTKIIITSMNIEYDPMLWDLNYGDGIGSMPMFAKINLSFNFIGGSNLSGPIARLQNALSFNYYANTEVYDNRAEQVLYENGTDEISKLKTFP